MSIMRKNRKIYRVNPSSKRIVLMRALIALESVNHITITGFSNLRYLRNMASQYRIYIKVYKIGDECYRISLRDSGKSEFLSVGDDRVQIDVNDVNKEGLFNLRQDLADMNLNKIEESVKLRGIEALINSEVPDEITKFERKWETRTPTIGKSGYEIEGYSYYNCNEDIPEDWIVYHREFNCLFKPKYVKNPVLLSNKTPRSIGVPDTTRFIGRVTPEEAERRFQFLSTYGQEKK